MYTPQHQPSNALDIHAKRYTTDDYLVSELQLQNNLLDIEYKKNAMEYIEVSDREIACVRSNCDEDSENKYNEITRGDAVAIILAKHFKEYKGLVNQDGDDEPLEIDLGETESVSMKTPKKKIFDSMYDHVKGVTIYFIK